MANLRDVTAAARRLGRLLERHELKIVLAESCTGGLISASLTTIPGISAYHCGSAVVYQVETKAEWLGISPAVLEKPGPVSRVVATAMAENVLRKTPKANLSAAVTGHLGPGAPKNQDGLIYAAVAMRGSGTTGKRQMKTVVKKHLLVDERTGARARRPEEIRLKRQRSAALYVLSMASAQIESQFQ